MAVNADQVCRLCLAKEDHESGVVLNNIQEYLPFLDSFAGLSQATVMPQKICSNCEFQIESSQLLRKRAQYTESLWIKYKVFQPSTGLELLMSCHMCNESMDCYGLVNHIETVHGEAHFLDCDLCASIRGGNPVIEDPQPVVKMEPLPNRNWNEPSELENSDCDDDGIHDDREDPETSDDDDLPLKPPASKSKTVTTAEGLPETYILPFNSHQRFYIDKIQQANEAKPTLKCRTCGFTTKVRITILRHIAKSHQTDLIKVVARALQEEEIDDLITKTDNHDKENTVTYTCSVCGQSSGRAAHCRDHIKRKHQHLEVGVTTDNPDNIPILSEKDLRFQVDADDTMDTNDSGREIFDEEQDKSVFLRKNLHIWEHIRKFYEMQGPVKTLFYQCKLCEYKTDGLVQIKNHVNTHLVGSDQVDKRSETLRKDPHIWLHVKKDFIMEGTKKTRVYYCKICNHSTRASGGMKIHVSHHLNPPPKKDDKDPKPAYAVRRDPHIWEHLQSVFEYVKGVKTTVYVCKICNHKSQFSNNAKAHVKNHLDTEPHLVRPGTSTGKKGKVTETHPEANIWPHIEKVVSRNHLGKRITYSCKICGKNSNGWDNMVKHVRISHKNKIKKGLK